MIGTQKDTAGLIVKKDHFRSAKKILKQGEKLPKHAHADSDLVFIVVKGKFQMLLDSTEEHLLVPGQVLTFDGKHSLEGTALEDTEFVVVRIQKA